MPQEYILARDIIIPAGTPLHEAAARVIRSDRDGKPAITSGKPAHFVEAVIGPTADTTFSWVMHIDDGLACGIISPA